MANVNLHFSATVRDELGTESTVTSYLSVPDTVTAAGLVTALGTWCDDLDAIIGGSIENVRISLTPAVPGGLKASPAAGSRVEQTGVFSFSVIGTSHRWGVAVPSIANAKIAAGKIDLTDADVAAFTGLETGAVAGGTYTNNTGQSLVAVEGARLSFRKHRKQLSRSSFEV